MSIFKPNIYPIMYWGLLYGLIAGFVLFVIYMLSRYINVIWFPVFLAGVVWGGYRNYQKQKNGWSTETGQPIEAKPVFEEMKEAAKDVVGATREMMAQQEQQPVETEEVEFEPTDEEEIRPPAPPSGPPTPPSV